MPTYLVRIIASRDLVGVFSADSIIQLIDIIDECTEPDACEYARLPPGGIMWTSPATPIPIDVLGDADLGDPDPIPWSDASFTELWWSYVFGYATCRCAKEIVASQLVHFGSNETGLRCPDRGE
jgi:hypothetical protein